MMKRGLIFLLVLTLVLSTFLVGCGSTDDQDTGGEPEEADVADTDDEDVDDGEPEGTLVVGMTEASGNFNPAYYSSAYDGHVVDMVFESLIKRNADGEFVEGEAVAESWEYSNDDKTITFKMKEDRVFSDGEPLTAHDVVFTYKVLADPSYTGRYGSTVKDLKGFEEYYGEETEEFEGVVALDDYTVEFNFREPLRTNLAECGFAILPEHHYGKDFTYGDTSSVEEITSDVLGSGPYVVEDFQEKELIYLTRNMDWVGEGYLIEDIILKFVDDTTDITELTTGNVDLLNGVVAPKKIAEAKEAGMEFNRYPRSGYGYVKTNNEWGPTSEVEVRQALYYAFNIEEFVESYYEDEETGEILANTQSHPFSQVSWAVDDALLEELNDYEFDLDKAREILDEAGWELNSDGIREKDGEILELKVAAMPDHDILDTLIPMWERDWGEGLGIELDISYQEFNTVLDYVQYDSDANVDKWSLFFLAVSISSPDPHVQYSTFHSDYIGNGMDNTSRYSNPEVDKLFDEAKAIIDEDEARPIYREIVKILNEEAAMMPVYANIYHDLYNPKLTNFETDSLVDWVEAIKDARVTE